MKTKNFIELFIAFLKKIYLILNVGAIKTVIQITVTAIISVVGTLYVQRTTLEDAKIQTLRAEQRASFIEIWATEEKYAFSLQLLQERAGITKLAAQMPANNPAAQIFLEDFRLAQQRSHELQQDAKLILATKKILLSEFQVKLASSFLVMLSDDDADSPAQKEERMRMINSIRLQAKNEIGR
ncbi:MAG: hypothetical protein V4568_01985 [Pseudomonadota bacterium]